jgi:hypothetical protein
VSKKKQEKQDKPIVKVPRGKIGRAVFAGSQVAGAISAVRAIRAAREKSDKLALLHGALSAATLIVTVLIAVRTMRADAEKNTDPESAEPLLLAVADR